MRRILITGSNRGIGLDLTKRYLQQDDTFIFATCRHPSRATELNVLAEQNAERIQVVQLDVTSPLSIAESVEIVGQQVDGLDLLINNAGVLPGGVAAREANISTFGLLEANAMLHVFQVNTVAPVMVTQAYAELLRSGQDACVVNMSSDAGSIQRRESGCDYSYPASKAALNMMTRCLAGDFRADAVTVISIHPGWIQTDMGGPHARLTLDKAIPSMMRVLDNLTLVDSGKFLNWDGTEVAW